MRPTFVDFTLVPDLMGSVSFKAFGGTWAMVYTFVLILVGLSQWSPYVPIFFQRLDKIRAARGDKGVGLYLKECKTAVMAYLCKEPLGSCGVRLDRGLPVIIPKPLRLGMMKGDLSSIRAVLTLLSRANAIYWKSQPNLRPIITVPFRSLTGMKRVMSKEIELALKVLKIGKFRVTVYDSLKTIVRATNKSGPNGHALLSSHWDALALSQSALWDPFKLLAKSWGMPFLIPLVESLAGVTGAALRRYPSLTAFLPARRLILGKIGLKEEACGKVRVFAISDFWTQTICKPLHDWAMAQLKLLPTDGTWDQGRAAERVRLATASGKKLFSFDLTAATDRFPVLFLTWMLSYLVGEAAALAWRTLLCDRDYWLRKRVIRYGTGQPMGTLSSWAIFSIAHHVCIQIAARRAFHTGLFLDYAILGDDVVIFNEDVAEAYRTLMNSLGVEFSKTKTLEAKGVAEFAKRQFLRGHEVTGVPGGLIALMSKTLSGLRVLVESMLQRGFQITHESLWEACAALGSVPLLETRAWRWVLISLLGPECPLAVRPALWGALFHGPLTILTWIGCSPAEFSRLPLLKSSGADLIGPLPCELDTLELEICRLFSFRTVRKSREHRAKWINDLRGSLDSIRKGWVLSYSEGLKEALAQWPALRVLGRELIELGHPITALDPLHEEEPSLFLEWKLDHDLSIPLRKEFWVRPPVVGHAPTGDLEILLKAKADSRFAWDVAKCCGTALPLAIEWQEPGALEMIREGLMIETGDLLS